MLTPDFAKQEDLERYEAFMAKLVELIVDKYDGSLKAEHGTGINMAPYVEREWGEKATELMWRIKGLADPDGVLAPGVVLNRDPGVHLRNLKTTPPIEESATTCVECGFCEPVCPSRNLTTTPRQRIVLRREMARQPEGSPVREALLEEYEYDGARDLRRRRQLPARLPARDRHRQAGQGAARASEHGERAEKRGPARGAALGGGRERASRGGPAGRRARSAAAHPKRGTGAARAAAASKLPLDHRARAPPPSTCPPASTGSSAAASPGPPAEALVEVSRARRPAGLDPRRRRRPLLRPALELEGLRRRATARWPTRWSSGSGAGAGRGRCRSSIDAASCTQGVSTPATACSTRRTPSASPALEILDSVAWAHDRLLPGLEVDRKVELGAVHPTCATRHIGLAGRLALARRASSPTRSRRPLARPAAASPATAASPPGADRVGDRAPRPRSSTAATSTPTSPATAPARSG